MMTKLILLIEDNTSDIELTRRALQKSHVANELVVLEDGQDALDYFFGDTNDVEREKQMPTLILLDLKLPRVDGLQVWKEIRSHKETKYLPVVILTTSNEERDIVESYNLGANSYIRKPVDFNQFVEAVQGLGLYWLVINQPPPLNLR